MSDKKNSLNGSLKPLDYFFNLFINLSFNSHSLYLFTFFFIHLRVVNMLLRTFAMLKWWPYNDVSVEDDVTSFDVTPT